MHICSTSSHSRRVVRQQLDRRCGDVLRQCGADRDGMGDWLDLFFSNLLLSLLVDPHPLPICSAVDQLQISSW